MAGRIVGGLRRFGAVSARFRDAGLCGYALAVLPAAAIYIFLNEVRYHTWWDQGLNWIPNIGDTVQNPRWGLKYVPFNLKTMLILMPKFNSHRPWMQPHFLGQGMLVTSPAFLLAWRGKPWTMAACAGIVAIPMLLTFTNGFGQFGARHFIPMVPFLLVIMAQRPLGTVGKALIVLSIVLVTFGIVSVHIVGLVAPW